MIAEIGTPCGSSQCGEIDGHCAAGAVKREFGCAAFSVLPGIQRFPFQSSHARVGGRIADPLPPGEHVVGQRDVREEGVLLDGQSRAFGLVFMLVPGATPKKPYSGLIA